MADSFYYAIALDSDQPALKQFQAIFNSVSDLNVLRGNSLKNFAIRLISFTLNFIVNLRCLLFADIV